MTTPRCARRLLVAAATLLLLAGLPAQDAPRRARGPAASPDHFPIAVWLQSPRHARRYRAAGFNLFVGLWKGPTEEQLTALRAAGMPVVCSQNEVGLRHLDDDIIVGWLHDDEPDNARSLGKGKGYGPPVAPDTIVARYRSMRRRDPTRPVLLNLGQAVAWDGYPGRGVRTGHPEDYAAYARGADIVSFDIYPAASRRREVHGKLWLVAEGVRRLRGWAADDKVVWNCIECTRISSDTKATPQQVEAEVWMSIIHGSRGLIYFVHQFEPRMREAALLDDAEMLAAVTAINRRVGALAAVINGPDVAGVATVESARPDVPIAMAVKRHDGAVYLFTVAMRGEPTRGSFAVAGLPARASAEVLGEDRRIEVRDGRLADGFAPWGVHLYRLR